MIYSNFLFFIVAIILYSSAPEVPSPLFSPLEQLIWMALILFFFWQLNRHHFGRLRRNHEDGLVDLSGTKREYQRLISLYTLVSILLFAIELFLFNIKSALASVPILGRSEIFMNLLGLGVFLLHLVVVWYWASHFFGDILGVSRTPSRHIWGNIKFNLVIVIPWLFLSLIIDILNLAPFPFMRDLMNSALAQVVFVALLLLVIAVLAPVLIARLWDCRPLGESDLKKKIVGFCDSQGVRFKKILSWNALNRGLVTAGVVGLLKPFRYLLITPGLIRLLDPDEIVAVVSHEVGHVKRKHLLSYFGFFIGFMVLIFALLDRLLNLFLNTGLGFSLVVSPGGELNLSVLSFLRIFLSILIFVLYFRFVFGYFMRNFEREADLYCFQSGVNPDHLISSFLKLGHRIGDDGKRANWHHYNISQRIDFLKRSQENPDLIGHHRRKVKRSLALFFAGLLVFSALSFNPLASRMDSSLVVGVIQKLVRENPEDPRFHSYLAMLYYQQEKWNQAKKAYETAIELNPRQPDALNNLAWLLLKCPDPELRDEKKALDLAEQAFRLRKAPHILDTLAEAYLANSQYKKAVIAARGALELAKENLSYYRNQLKKMTRAYKTFGNSIAI